MCPTVLRMGAVRTAAGPAGRIERGVAHARTCGGSRMWCPVFRGGRPVATRTRVRATRVKRGSRFACTLRHPPCGSAMVRT